MFDAFKPLVVGKIEAEQGYYHVIDVVRGLAACAILFWHYQHLIALGMAPAGSRGDYPLYAAFGILYDHGGAAVQLFWIISGFVFAAVYAASGVSARSFFEHRVARLYPLHIVTLFVVVGLQWLCRDEFGTDLLYTENTLKNFGLQLVMGTGWGLGGSHSFNGPIWSVSAEVFIYALFWMTLRFLFRWRLVLPMLLSVGFFLLSTWSPIAACGAYFFLGCAVYVAHRIFPLWAQYAAAAGSTAVFAALLYAGMQGIAVLFLFAGLTLCCAALEGSRASRWAEKIPWIANNTYGVYLWHIPVQLALLLALSSLGIDRAVAFSPWFLLLFVASVTIVARMSFLWIEDPARKAIRRGFVRPDPSLGLSRHRLDDGKVEHRPFGQRAGSQVSDADPA